MRVPLLLAALLAALPALACNYPDEGNMPLRRALTRVQMLPDAATWHRERRDAGDLVRFELFIDKEVRMRGKCYWTVEASADGKLWRRFFVTPDGRSVLRESDLKR